MNVLIVSEKSEVKSYTAIINSAPDASALGSVTHIGKNFIDEIKTKWHPHLIIFDTAISIYGKKTAIQIVDTLSVAYPYIKIIVMTDEDDNSDYKSFKTVRGTIKNTELAEIVKAAERQTEPPPEKEALDDGSSPTVDLKQKNKNDTGITRRLEGLRADNLSAKNEQPKRIRLKKLQKGGGNKRFLIPVIAAAAAAAVISVVIVVSAAAGSDKSNSAASESVYESNITEYTTYFLEPAEEINESYSTAEASAATEADENITAAAITQENNAQSSTGASTTKATEAEKESTQAASSKSAQSSASQSSKAAKSSQSSSVSSGSSKSSSSSQSTQSTQSNQSATSRVSSQTPAVSYGGDTYSNSSASGVTAIRLSYSSKTLNVYDAFVLTASVTPSNTSEKIVWSSNNENVASVSSSGKVTAKAAGTAYITASCGGKSASCKVTVS